MKLFHTRTVSTADDVLYIMHMDKLIEIYFGTKVPNIDPAWMPKSLISIENKYHCLRLENRTNTASAYWFFDENFAFLSNNSEEFLVRSDYVKWKILNLSTDTSNEYLVEDIYHLIDSLSSNSNCKNDLFIEKFDDNFCNEEEKKIFQAIYEMNIGSQSKSSIFNEMIGRDIIKNRKIVANFFEHDIIFDFFLPLQNFWYIGYSTSSDKPYCMLITNHNKTCIAIMDLDNNKVFCRQSLQNLGIDSVVLLKIKLWFQYFVSLISEEKVKNERFGVVFRENHIGHYLWNELSVVDHILDMGHKVSAFLYNECNEPVFHVDEIFPSLINHTYRGLSDNLKIMQSALLHGVSFFPYMEFHISQKLADRITIIANRKEHQLKHFISEQNKNHFVILIGLRLENRCWVRQKEGYCSIIRELGKQTKQKYLLIFDGHNFIGDSQDKFVQSYLENSIKSDDDIPSIVKSEIEMIKYIEEYKNNSNIENVKIMNLVPCSIASSIVAANCSNYFVTHWGAGLAKYKWIANLEGFIISSKTVLKNKGDLHIYDSEEFRENAIECDYYDYNHVQDLKNSSQIIEVVNSIGFRDNFDADPNHFAKSVIENIETDI